jgi:hypothetical protein
MQDRPPTIVPIFPGAIFIATSILRQRTVSACLVCYQFISRCKETYLTITQRATYLL